jgi:uncharacterized protein
MKPLVYHPGQRTVQEEAGTVRVADKLADWVGPVPDFARGADLVVLALPENGSGLRFALLSGAAPIVRLDDGPELRLGLPAEFAAHVDTPTACGGLVISLGLARRARINGFLYGRAAAPELVATEAFTLCRKYFAPSIPVCDAPLRVGPSVRSPLALDHPLLGDVLKRAETAFLATISPDGMPDVAHRGGAPSFLEYDPVARRLCWNEYVGDGVFKSAGNVRATGTMALLALDLASGDAVCLYGRGDYRNIRADRGREDALVQHREDHPQQGVMACEIVRAERLRDVLHPRRRVDRVPRITSRSTVPEQKPQ